MIDCVRPLAVLFDMGGTIEDITIESETYACGAAAIAARLRQAGVIAQPPPSNEFARLIEDGLRQYKKDLTTAHDPAEHPPREIWTRWILPSAGLSLPLFTEELAEEISFLWETRCLKRHLRPDVRQVLDELKRRGYALGVISNSISRSQVGHTLRLYGLEPYLTTVQVSSVTGRRKPDPAMFAQAAADLRLLPRQCMHVGDTFTRDVLGARAAGYGFVLWISSSFGKQADAEFGLEPAAAGKPVSTATWEGRITSLTEILSVLDETPWCSEKEQA